MPRPAASKTGNNCSLYASAQPPSSGFGEQLFGIGSGHPFEPRCQDTIFQLCCACSLKEYEQLFGLKPAAPGCPQQIGARFGEFGIQWYVFSSPAPFFAAPPRSWHFDLRTIVRFPGWPASSTQQSEHFFKRRRAAQSNL